MDTVANVRIRGETHKQPIELFALEKPHLNALPPLPADTGVIRTVPTSSRFRVVLDTNRYSVPSLYASQPLLLKSFADRLCIYHGEKLIATHTRSYDRHQTSKIPSTARNCSISAVQHATPNCCCASMASVPVPKSITFSLRSTALTPALTPVNTSPRSWL